MGHPSLEVEQQLPVWLQLATRETATKAVALYLLAAQMAFRNIISFQYRRGFIKQADNKPDSNCLDWNAGFNTVDCHKALSTKNLNTFLAKWEWVVMDWTIMNTSCCILMTALLF
jgi:hypothetical protein